MVPFYPQGKLIIRGLTDSLDLIWAVADTPFDFFLLFGGEIKVHPPPPFANKNEKKKLFILSGSCLTVGPWSANMVNDYALGDNVRRMCMWKQM